jgi:hypothetical protein
MRFVIDDSSLRILVINVITLTKVTSDYRPISVHFCADISLLLVFFCLIENDGAILIKLQVVYYQELEIM